jgi:phage host-nuclease inhibitor protein Gam
MKKQAKTDTVTLDEVRHVVDWIVTANHEVDIVTAQMNAELQAVRQKYAKVQDLTKTIQERQDVVETFAKRHKELFVDPRFMDLGRAIIGFRLGPHELRLRRGRTWKEVAVYIVGQVAAGYLDAKYLRYWDPDVNKEALLEDREPLTQSGMLDELGLRVEQADNFYLEPKHEEVPVQKAG